jgi:hypothetical protein
MVVPAKRFHDRFLLEILGRPGPKTVHKFPSNIRMIYVKIPAAKDISEICPTREQEVCRTHAASPLYVSVAPQPESVRKASTGEM